MKNTAISTFVVIMLLSFVACKPIQTAESSESASTPSQQSFVSIFEIPATNITRAIDFYQGILAIKIETYDFGEMQMGVFPYENQMVTGTIIQGEGYQPSADGPTLYLNAGIDLQPMLDRVSINGGDILLPKTPHADESGYFALFLDSEGNKIGLHSTK
ncbi:MAG: VOC family protein [Bacteroidota bacterium]